MIKKIIASDIDGTLIPFGTTDLDPKIFDLINRLYKKGIMFVPASGRTIHSLKELFAPVIDKLSFLSENGSVVWIGETPVIVTPIPKDLLTEIAETIYEDPNSIAYSTSMLDGYLYAKDKEYGEMILHKNFYPYAKLIESLDELEDNPVKITSFSKDPVSKRLELFNKKFGNKINVMVAGPDVIDFCIANKGLGLKLLTQYFNLTPDDVYAFGDNYNDVSMLEFAGNSYIMKTDDENLLSSANHVCTNVIDEIEKILEEN